MLCVFMWQVALLEAHAHCAVLAAGSTDDATRRVVAKAQAPHASLLMGSWLGWVGRCRVCSLLIQCHHEQLMLRCAA